MSRIESSLLHTEILPPSSKCSFFGTVLFMLLIEFAPLLCFYWFNSNAAMYFVWMALWMNPCIMRNLDLYKMYFPCYSSIFLFLKKTRALSFFERVCFSNTKVWRALSWCISEQIKLINHKNPNRPVLEKMQLENELSFWRTEVAMFKSACGFEQRSTPYK